MARNNRPQQIPNSPQPRLSVIRLGASMVFAAVLASNPAFAIGSLMAIFAANKYRNMTQERKDQIKADISNTFSNLRFSNIVPILGYSAHAVLLCLSSINAALFLASGGLGFFALTIGDAAGFASMSATMIDSAISGALLGFASQVLRICTYHRDFPRRFASTLYNDAREVASVVFNPNGDNNPAPAPRAANDNSYYPEDPDIIQLDINSDASPILSSYNMSHNSSDGTVRRQANRGHIRPRRLHDYGRKQ